MALIVCKNLSIGYNSSVVLEHINFQVNQGDYLCIKGENGSGKSTLMKTCLGLIPPIFGEISFGEGLKRTEIGYLPQQTIAQKDFPASCREIVLSGCLNHCGLRPFYNKNEKKLAEYNMQKMGVYGLKDKCYRELSGGQQQRVLLARALCATSKMILLDEPVAGLDPKAMSEMYELIYELNQEEITVIMISHDVKTSFKYASHILDINNESIFWGTKDEYQLNIKESESLKRGELFTIC